jgi:hypothetical protein
MTRFLAATAALAALAVLSGCSGHSVGRRTRANATVQSSSSDCAFKEITAGARREGTCVARGVSVIVVDRPHWLHGTDYDGRILDVETADALSAVRARGRFVVVRLRVKNALDIPQPFDLRSDLAFLLVDGKYFGESSAAERRLAQSFRRRALVLQPDEAASGTVVFDLPAVHAKHIAQTGSNLILVPFREEAKEFPTGTQPLDSVGYIRLWK